MKTKYKEWTLIDWDGNPELGYKCWRKSFGRGHVSVGVGEFLHVVYSYGADSDDSLSSTRWNYDAEPLTPEVVMAAVDKNRGKSGDIGHTEPADWEERQKERQKKYLRFSGVD